MRRFTTEECKYGYLVVDEDGNDYGMWTHWEDAVAWIEEQELVDKAEEGF